MRRERAGSTEVKETEEKQKMRLVCRTRSRRWERRRSRREDDEKDGEDSVEGREEEEERRRVPRYRRQPRKVAAAFIRDVSRSCLLCCYGNRLEERE